MLNIFISFYSCSNYLDIYVKENLISNDFQDESTTWEDDADEALAEKVFSFYFCCTGGVIASMSFHHLTNSCRQNSTILIGS